MTYGRRHYLTQQVLVRLAYGRVYGSETHEFLKASVRLVLAMTLIFLGLLGVASGQELTAGAVSPERQGVSPNAATTGEFLYRTEIGAALEVAPLVETRVRFDVTGVIARAVVIQRFRNPLNQWIEGVYVFPLPESSAVDHMRMRVGDRVIEGQIREKEKARQEFRQAAAEGKRATLVEQQRPNLFTSRVANLGPLEELEVEIEYQQTLSLEEGRVGLRFPLAITPRYVTSINSNLARLTAGNVVPEAEDDDRSSRFEGDDETGTGDEQDGLLQPPLLPLKIKGNPVSIELNLNAGFDVASVSSDTHKVVVEPLSPHQFHARLREEFVPADRDFEISWRPSPGVMPQSSITTEAGPDGTYALVTLFPPTGGAARSARIPREVAFVIDTSGSMEGVSMQQAKKALGLAIDRLDPSDSFNLIQFNSETSVLFSSPVPASSENRERALRYAASLRAQGGTEMLPALVAALAPNSENEPGGALLKQVIFLTDGAVSNEDQLFSVIKNQLGRARLFTVGIGSAPNSHFMTKAAEFGRGTFTFISDVNGAEKQMTELYEKVESPVLSDIQVSFDGVPEASAEVWPARIPDLYLGEPVVVGARFETVPTLIRVRGNRDGEPFETVVPVAGAETGRGINVLWARRKIQSLLDGVHEGEDPEAVRAKVVSLGLTHHLVTKHTSLVAVDLTPVRRLDESMESVMVPVNLPNGSTFGSLPQSATPATLLLLQGLVGCLTAAVLLAVSRR